MLDSEFTAILETKNREEFQREVVRFARDLGFDTVSASAVIDCPSGSAKFITVDNVPLAYRGFFENPKNFGEDPVMQHCKVRHVPIVWDQSTYVREGEGLRWEYQARFGLRFGIAMALHLPKGRHFFIGLDRDRALPSCATELTRLVAAVSLFVTYANEASSTVLVPPAELCGLPALTHREREVMRWTLDGKTAWEVGVILGISARTAAIHANNAAHKLGCVSKHQAALKALRCELL